MHRLILSLLFVVAITLLGLGLRTGSAESTERIYLPLVRCPTCTGTAPVTPSPTPDLETVEPVRRELLALVNAARADAGCPAAREDPLLMRATQEWSVYMAVNKIYEHSQMDWYVSQGIDYARAENIGPMNADAQRMFNAWVNSPGHRHNMLTCPSETYDYVMGVGYFDANWTFTLGWHEP